MNATILIIFLLLYPGGSAIREISFLLTLVHDLWMMVARDYSDGVH